MKIFTRNLSRKLALLLGLCLVSFNNFSQTNVTLTAGGELTITGSGTTDDVFIITDDGTYLSIYNEVEGYTFSDASIIQISLNTILVPLSGITSSITVDGTAGNDAVTLNLLTALPAINVTTQNITSLIQQGSLTTTTGNVLLAANESASIDGDVITTSGSIEVNVNDTVNNEIIINGRLESVSGTIDVKGLQETQMDGWTVQTPGLMGITINSTADITSVTGDITITTIQRDSGDIGSRPIRCSINGANISSTGIGANAAKINIQAKGVISTALSIKDATITSIDGDISLEGSNSGFAFNFTTDGVLVLDNASITATGNASISIQSEGGQMIQSPAVFINNTCTIQCHNGDMLISGNFDAQLGVDSEFIRNVASGTTIDNNDGGIIDNSPQGVLISGILYGDKKGNPMFPDTNTIISSTGLGTITINGKTPPVVGILGTPMGWSSTGTEQFISGVTIAEYTTIQSDIADININGISNKFNPQSNEVGVNLRGQALIENNSGDINIIGQNNTTDSNASAVAGKTGIQISDHQGGTSGSYGGYIKSISGNINLESKNTSGPSAIGYNRRVNSWRTKTATGTIKIDANHYNISTLFSILSLNNQPNNFSLEIDAVFLNPGSSIPYQLCGTVLHWYGEEPSTYDPISNHDVFSDFIYCMNVLGNYSITTKTPGRGISINTSVGGTLSLNSSGFKDGATSVYIGGATAGNITVGNSTFTDPLFLTGEDIIISNLNTTNNPLTLTSKSGHYITATNNTSVGITASEVTINGVVSPGGEAMVSNLKATSNVTFSAEDTFSVDILATGNDQLLLQGTAPVLNLGNSVLDINLETGFTPALGSTFTIVDVAGTEAVAGTFNNLPEGRFLTVEDNTFVISYTAGDGNDIVLTKVDLCASFSAIIYVDAAVSGGSGNGTSWANALTDLQPAIEQAINCNNITEIRVAAGTYLPTENPNGSTTTATDRNNAFHLNTDIIIKGSYNPSTDTQDYNNPSILSGDFNGNDVITGAGASLSITNNTENAYHVFITTGLSNATLIDGFTLQGGNASENGGITYTSESFRNDYGGGMYNIKSSPTLSNITFLGNSSDERGGGMQNFNLSSPIINNATFSNNISDIAGGAICNISADINEGVDLTTASSPIITNSLFSGNSAGSRAGGIYNVSSLASISNTSFLNNSAGNGGGMYNISSSSISISNVLFNNNTAVSGGAIKNEFSSPIISSTKFFGNTATTDGGGISNKDSSPTVTNCVLDNNSANGSSFVAVGGGISNTGNSSPIITNTIFTNNSAIQTISANAFGGGLSNFDSSSPTLTNVTFFGNSTNGSGGGISNRDSSSSTLHNTVLYNNGTDIVNVSSGVTTGANNFSENFVQAGFTALTSDPFINSVDPDGADNIFATSDDGLIPSIGSPLINAGDSSLNTEPTDITGQQRVEGISIDVGAYENQGTSCIITTTYTMAGGWDNGLPSSFTIAVIAENYNTATTGLGDITACELIINTGVTLTIADGNFVNVENDMTVNGTLEILNTGSLVQMQEDAVTINNGTINVSKTTPTIDDRNFVAMSSPVTAEARDRVYGNSRAVFSIIPQNFVPFVIDFGTFPEFEFAENFLDDNGDYLLPVTGSTAIPPAGIGQLIFPQPEPNVGDGAYTLTYTQDPSNPGTLNSGIISVPINYNGPVTTNNYNLLGNPYASAIDVEAFINANDAVNEVYYWDHLTNPTSDLPGFGTSNFSMNDVSLRNAMMGIAAVNGGTAPGQFMASGQGFGIKADQAEMMDGTPVVFTNSIRVTGNNGGFRSIENQIDIDKLWLNLTTPSFDEATAQTGIGFIAMASPEIDKGYDSPRVGTFLSLFTMVDSGELLGIQTREAFHIDIEITLGFSTSIEEESPYTISIAAFEGMAIENNSVFIIDHLLSTIVNLKEESYTFTAQKGLHTDRFTIVFQDRDVLSVDGDSFRESGISIYPNPSNGQITLAYAGASSLENAVITDANGKIIKRINLQNFNKIQTMDLDDLAKGMYFMQITSQETTIVKKLVIRY